MSGGDDTMARWIAGVRQIGTMPEDTAKAAAPLVEAAARRTASAGTTPTGQPWSDRKKGGRALEHAADAITAEASGASVAIVLRGPEVYHHHGVGKTIPQRQIIPVAGDPVPPAVADAITKAAEQTFRRAVGGGS